MNNRRYLEKCDRCKRELDPMQIHCHGCTDCWEEIHRRPRKKNEYRFFLNRGDMYHE